MRRALPFALLILLAGCQPSPPKAVVAPRGIPTPDTWPLREITLPPASDVEAFKPAAGAPTKDVESYTVYFAYPESPKEVLDHIEEAAKKAGMEEVERQEIDPNGAQDSRRVDWKTKDAKWTVSIRYWKVNAPYPYQLIITPNEA